MLTGYKLRRTLRLGSSERNASLERIRSSAAAVAGSTRTLSRWRARAPRASVMPAIVDGASLRARTGRLSRFHTIPAQLRKKFRHSSATRKRSSPAAARVGGGHAVNVAHGFPVAALSTRALTAASLARDDRHTGLDSVQEETEELLSVSERSDRSRATEGLRSPWSAGKTWKSYRPPRGGDWRRSAATLPNSRSRHLLPGRACFTISRLDAEPIGFRGRASRDAGTAPLTLPSASPWSLHGCPLHDTSCTGAPREDWQPGRRRSPRRASLQGNAAVMGKVCR